MTLGCAVVAACSRSTAGMPPFSTPPGDPTAEKSALAAEMSETTSDGMPVFATRFPVAPQSLGFSEDIKAQVASGRPQSCGFAVGPDNVQFFEFATYFQAQGRWYFLTLDTDKASRPYRGPGSYDGTASLTPTIGSGPRYRGGVHLTVARDSAPDSGSVSGTLSGSEGTVTISGQWTCSPGGELGPA